MLSLVPGRHSSFDELSVVAPCVQGTHGMASVYSSQYVPSGSLGSSGVMKPMPLAMLNL
jgi:hypothetical protein